MDSDFSDLIDKGVYCWDCNRYYWYDEIKGMKCPKGHSIGEK